MIPQAIVGTLKRRSSSRAAAPDPPLKDLHGWKGESPRQRLGEGSEKGFGEPNPFSFESSL
jgi:hypothetical protein